MRLKLSSGKNPGVNSGVLEETVQQKYCLFREYQTIEQSSVLSALKPLFLSDERAQPRHHNARRAL